MGNTKKVKDFLTKKHYDFERSDISLYNFHPQFFIIFAMKGIFFGRRDSYLRFLIPVCSVGITILGLVLECLNIYRGLSTHNYSLACESFCYFIMLGVVIVIYSGILLNKSEIIGLLEDMDVDFKQVCSLGPRYREPFLESQLLIWKLCFGWAAFIGFVGSLFIMYPVVLLVYQSLLATQDEYTIRPLVFPLWLPTDDPYRTPNYEIFFFIETLYTVIFVMSFGGYVYTIFHFLLHFYIMMDMIILDFKVIFDGLDESVASLHRNNPRRLAVQSVLNNRLKRIVHWHLSVHVALKSVSSIFRPPLLYQVIFSSVGICLMAYQIVETLEKGGFNLLFTSLAVAACLQLWIPCYLGTLLRNKGFAVGDACWNCGWHETGLGKMIRVDIVIIILRAQMPILIKYTGQPVIQLETFSAIMSTSYSYFNMLRQSAK